MTNYSVLAENVQRSDFENIHVVRNADSNSDYQYGKYTIAPKGALLTSSNGNLIAGILTSYDNTYL